MLRKYLEYLFALSYVAFLVSQLCLASVYLFGFPLRAYCILVAFLLYIVLSAMCPEKGLIPEEKPVLLIYGGFTVCAILAFIGSTIWYGETLPLISFISLLFKFLLQGLMVFLITGFFIRRFSSKSLVKMIVGLGTVSAAVAISQFMQIPLAWKLKYFFTTDVKQYIAEFILSHDDRRRAVGLSLYFISLSYEMLLLIPAAIYAFMTGNSKKEKFIFGVMTLVLIGGLIASKTISAYLGLALFVAWLLWKNRYYKVLGAASVVFVIVAIAMPQYAGSILNTLLIRRGFWTIASLTISRFPLGLPFLRSYTAHAEQFYPLVQNSCGDIIGSAPHNQFLNTFLSYGVLSAIPYLFFIVWIFKKRVSNALFLQATVVAYGAHSFFHNLGPFYNGVFIWTMISFYTYSLAKREYHEDFWKQRN